VTRARNSNSNKWERWIKWLSFAYRTGIIINKLFKQINFAKLMTNLNSAHSETP